jgi:thioredoxin-dependent peroxiredoxin
MLKIGEVAPDFLLPDQNGNLVRLSDFRNNNVVIFFYPKDLTPGCSMQSCSFRDNYEEFNKLNTKIIGISSDSIESHDKFVRKYNLLFSLLSDRSGKVRKLFKVKKTFGLLPGRATFVIDKNGTIRFTLSSQFNVPRHIKETLQFVRSMAQI